MKTVWSNPQAKLKPINIQAVKICFPAKGMNLPPEEEKKQNFAPTLEQQLRAEEMARDERIATIAADNALRELELERTAKERREKQKKQNEDRKPKNIWIAKYLRSMAKRTGMPKPTTAQLQAARDAAHLFGTPAFEKAINPSTVTTQIDEKAMRDASPAGASQPEPQ